MTTEADIIQRCPECRGQLRKLDTVYTFEPDKWFCDKDGKFYAMISPGAGTDSFYLTCIGQIMRSTDGTSN